MTQPSTPSPDQGQPDQEQPEHGQDRPLIAGTPAGEPPAAEPVAAGPVAAGPVAAGPVAAEPVAAEPVAVPVPPQVAQVPPFAAPPFQTWPASPPPEPIRVHVPPTSRQAPGWLWPVVGMAWVLLAVGVAVVQSNPATHVDLFSRKGPTQAARTAAPTYPTPYTPPTPSRVPRTTVPAPPTVPPSVYTGTGDAVITLDRPPGFAAVRFECPACSGHTLVRSDGADSLVVNRVGPFVGTRWLDVTGPPVTRLTVEVTGSWTMTVGGMDLVPTVDGVATGTDDAVFLVTRPTRTAQASFTGRGNFVVWVVELDRDYQSPDLRVNEIGDFAGVIDLEGPALVQVSGRGDWSVAPA
ncbi:hypothetical protein AB0I60_03705 [Actinosynnema sp. NPDC050436]|uniref:hypothetical protein n=1 Tax=Actinosynnema sp. NPDC050436 TaxID=3155659 RepID=UPI003410BA39